MTTPLPGILAEIAEIIGEDKARLLSEKLGGHRIVPSANPRPNSRLVRVIGAEAVAKLYREFQEDEIQLPMAGRRRDVVGQAMAREGRSVADIAGDVGVHERTAKRYKAAVRREPEPDPQQPLDLRPPVTD